VDRRRKKDEREMGEEEREHHSHATNRFMLNINSQLPRKTQFTTIC